MQIDHMTALQTALSALYRIVTAPEDDTLMCHPRQADRIAAADALGRLAVQWESTPLLRADGPLTFPIDDA